MLSLNFAKVSEQDGFNVNSHCRCGESELGILFDYSQLLKWSHAVIVSLKKSALFNYIQLLMNLN